MKLVSDFLFDSYNKKEELMDFIKNEYPYLNDEEILILAKSVASKRVEDMKIDMMKKKKQFNLKAKHKSKKGGLTEAGRKAYNKATGSNLKRPQPEGGKRKKSFCARNKGQIDMHNIDCRKTPEKRACKARKRWKC